MDVSAAFDVRIPGLAGGTCDLKQIYANKKQSYNCVNTAADDSVIAKLGNALGRILHVKDVQLQKIGFISLSAGDELCCAESNVLSGERKVDKTELLNLKSQASSNKYANFPCSGNPPAMFVSTNEKNEKDEIRASSTFASLSTFVPDKEEVPDLSLHPHAETLVELEDDVCEHQTTLSAATTRVSAMKGSREKLGIPLKKLNVTWAPDVYDPPPTSLSHVVKSHSRRSRSKKVSKHKHKGKSLQGSNNSGKRYPKHVGKSDIRSKSSPSWDRSLFGSYNQSTLELVDIAFTGHDPNCGSSCLKTSLVGVHVPIAEATS